MASTWIVAAGALFDTLLARDDSVLLADEPGHLRGGQVLRHSHRDRKEHLSGVVVLLGLLAVLILFALRPRRRRQRGDRNLKIVQHRRGNVVDFYEFERMRPLGQGGYGTVSKATNKSTRQVRAIKSIKRSGLFAQDRAQIENEIDIMTRMDHPNVVRLHETFDDYHCKYMVMELCTGGELFDAITTLPRFTEVQAAILMRQIVLAVHYMHRSQVCHRDLKPENFLFSTRESLEVSPLKLIDFGFACHFNEGEVLTPSLGTPYYIAPEVLHGSYNHACDLWSVGVIMYIMLTGRAPFKDREATLKGDVSFASVWDNISEDARDLVQNLLTMNFIGSARRRPGLPQRFTAEQTLHHDWISKKAPRAADVHLEDSFVDRLRGFQAESRLKKAALHVIARQLDDQQIKSLRNTFLAMDTNGDGVITSVELREGLARGGLADIPSDLEDIISTCQNYDHHNGFEYTEFVAAALEAKTYLKRDVCWAAFRVFDKDGSGSISQKELKAVVEDDHVHEVTGGSAALTLEQCDENGDGVIDFEEFMKMMEAPARSPKAERHA